jgi:hypothetical protein
MWLHVFDQSCEEVQKEMNEINFDTVFLFTKYTENIIISIHTQNVKSHNAIYIYFVLSFWNLGCTIDV